MTAITVGQMVRVVGYHMTGLVGMVTAIKLNGRRLNYTIRDEGGATYEGFERPDIRPLPRWKT